MTWASDLPDLLHRADNMPLNLLTKAILPRVCVPALKAPMTVRSRENAAVDFARNAGPAHTD
jgi:hypothetical protein